MSPQQFNAALGRVRRCVLLALVLTSCAALGLSFGLPAWGGAREWLHALPRRGAAGSVAAVLIGVLVPVSLFLVPLAAALWADRRFGLRCPGCRRSVTRFSRAGQALRTGRCGLCQRALFERGPVSSDGDIP
jgi:hypothetical protein